LGKDRGKLAQGRRPAGAARVAGERACYGGPVDGDSLALATSPLALVTAGVFGALWGSFFNVCIARLPRHQSVVRPGSHCFACGAPVRAVDNIPILSYFILRGRCRACGARFSLRYAAVEALTAGLSVLLYWFFVAGVGTGADDAGAPLGLRLARYLLAFAFAGVLVVLSFIDLDTKWLPDVITLPAIPVFLLAGIAIGDVPWLDRLIGGAVGYLAVRIISDGYYYLTGREGMGLGDGKLLAVIGVMLGWRSLPVVIFMASLLGVLVSVPVLLWQRRHQPAGAQPPAAPTPPAEPPPAVAKGDADADADADADGEGEPPAASIRRTEVPFGPFLALSALVYLFVGGRLWTWFIGRFVGE
jgi:leader peptidase (prepilin peptidase) / N-methyltransferase